MSNLKHSTHAVTIQAPFEKAWSFISDWRNQPKWATSFVKGIRKNGEQIIMTTPNGDVPIGWETNKDYGIVDMIFPGSSRLPTRLIAIGDSLVYTFTFSMPAAIPEEVFRQSQHNMDEELALLKQLLES